MAKRRIDRDKIIQAFLSCAFEKSAGAVSLADIASLLGVNKASLYNHFSSRDAIYEAAIDFCSQYMNGVRFISGSADSLAALSFADALEKIVKQYFRSYEIEPLFQMYAFIHSSKFFSREAFQAAEHETQKIADDTASLIVRFAAEGKLELSENGRRLKELSGADTSAKAGKQPAGVPGAESAGYANDADDIGNTNEAYTLQAAADGTASEALKERALFFARELSAELNEYIVEKKEMLRQNPESGAGSLFALPSDDSALAQIITRVTAYWTR